MNRLPGVLGVLLVLVLSMGFAALNGGQRVTLDLGFAIFYSVPLTLVVFSALILGMLVMLVAGMRTDLRVRRILRERLAREDEEERARMFVDRNQQDLFEEMGSIRAEGAGEAVPAGEPPPGPSATLPPPRMEQGDLLAPEPGDGAGSAPGDGPGNALEGLPAHRTDPSAGDSPDRGSEHVAPPAGPPDGGRPDLEPPTGDRPPGEGRAG